MADPTYAPIGDEADDLPRTFRREKEAREREARERAARERAAAPTLSTAPDEFVAPPKVFADHAAASGTRQVAHTPNSPAIVHGFDVPFAELVKFFLKAVIAAIPALILLMAILWGFGKLLSVFFPDLVKMKILIGFGG